MVEEKTSRGINEKLDSLLKLVGEKQEKKKKEFDLPFSLKLGAKTKIKKGYVLVFHIKTNGELKIRFLPLVNEMVYLSENETYHIASADYILRYKKYPALILPEWSLEPYSAKQHAETITDENKALPQKVIINAVKLAAIKPKMRLGGSMIFWLVILAIVGLYLASKMLGKVG